MSPNAGSEQRTSEPPPAGMVHPPPAPDVTAKLLPRFLQPRWPMPHRPLFGRLFPEARPGERLFWACGLLACLTVLYLAAFQLHPDPGGMGTHTQLGLPPCGFVELTGGPCPSCGYTTTFTLAAHGRPWDAFANQPFGFFVFVLTVLAVPLTALSTFGGVSLFGMSERWPWRRIFGVMLVAWLVAWAYKWSISVP